MTTVAAGRHSAAPAARGSADFAGTGQLLRLYLRRDRIVLPLWVIAFGMLPAFYVSATKGVYSSPADLANYAKTITDSPALIAMYGPVFSTEPGSMYLWKAGPFFAMIAIATILTVIRHTRVEEETGRAELVGATSIGRYAGLSAALVLTTAGCVLVGIIAAAMLYSNDLPIAGSVAYAATLAGSGLAWAGVAAAAAQVSTSSRIARGIALGALAAAYALRAIGDAGNGVLSWFSPLGWCIQMRAFAQERWWVLVPLLLVAVLTVAAAYLLLSRRDTGSGLVAERPGPPSAAPSLAGPLGLAWRLQRGSMVFWAIGFLLYGLLMGGAIKSVGNMLGDNDTVHDAITRMGGSTMLQDSFVTLALTLLAAGAAAYSLSATLRLHDEESSQRIESTLAGAVGRERYALSHIAFALLGPVLLMSVAGLAIGVVYGATDGDLLGKVADTLGAALVQVPAVWVCTGIAVALYGFAPRFTPVAWGVLSVLVVIFFVGSLDGLPQWVVDLVPFVHPPKLPGAPFEIAPVLWLLGIAAALLAAGLLAFRRRDLR
ncbi:ABC transporter permease [Nocardia brasiliensis]|uniref:ABC transporter permease n=1 Tax=Nocardia brasiliensis TaxID=37326 RepID=UPI0024554351|nr:ABC transporter permease [Nocardia brasiliensis]